MEGESEITLRDFLDWIRWDLTDYSARNRHGATMTIPIYTLLISCITVILTVSDSLFVGLGGFGFFVSIAILAVIYMGMRLNHKTAKDLKTVGLAILQGRIDSVDMAHQKLTAVYVRERERFGRDSDS